MRFNKLTCVLLAGAVAVTGGFEGYRHYAYQDPIGVWTACFGETAGIKPGDTFTREQCESMLSSSLDQHNAPIAQIPQQLPPRVHLASLDMAYNIGTGAFSQSTMYRYLLNADYESACNQIPRWRFAGGRDCAIKSNNCYGIVNRRAVVQQLCLGDIDVNEALAKIGQMPIDAKIVEQLDDHQ
ncbi:glycoside hydrolase family protein [Photobacterium phosphoreum]|uniref:lysozyme n=1 Tax=Photobacterium phosphoreum TaxID=659 RepID=UPI001E579B97|nr:lysozyme [Photobacterium phosphoreum]MCD9504537.1 glycoside hydrolase family protein [Photobacterium phosphoreum]